MNHCRLAIVLARRYPEASLQTILTTRYHKWSEVERDQLFQTIFYCPSPVDIAKTIFLKLILLLNFQSCDRLRRFKTNVGQLICSTGDANRIYYKITGVGHWFTFTTRPPRFWRGNEESSSTRESYVCFKSQPIRDTVFCLPMEYTALLVLPDPHKLSGF